MSETHHPSLNVTLPGTGPRRRGPGPLVVSLLVHLLIVAAIVLIRATEPWERTRTPGILGELPGGGGGGGGGGGEQVAYVSLPPAPAAPAAPTEAPAIPEPVVPPPEPEPEPQAEPVEAVVEPEPPVQVAVVPSDGAGAGSGTGQGAGLGPGSGGGTGGGSGGGEGTGIGTGTGPGTGGEGGSGRPPEPRQLILPPLESTPKALRGRTVTVTFWVRADGGVERITVDPPIADRGYAGKFEEAMIKYRFRPARDATGRPTVGSYTIDVELTSQ